jgi:outer membrane protein assembly factor BamD
VAATACKTGPNLALDYGQTAEENYDLAIGEYEDKDWDECIQYADFVRIRFPFSRYAVEAELLIARAEFGQGNYVTARDAFKQFAKLHPTHKHSRNGWASFMAAAAAYMNAPKVGSGILPPHYQRDQGQLQDSLDDLAYFFEHYPGSETMVHARKLEDDVKRRLLEHELYVAKFYLDRDRPGAAIGRLESAHDRFPGIGMDAEVLFLLGLTYLRIGEVELARGTFADLQARHATHHHGKQARIYLKYIYDTYGAADPARPRPDRSPPVPAAPPRPKNKKRPERPEAAGTPPTPTSGSGAR